MNPLTPFAIVCVGASLGGVLRRALNSALAKAFGNTFPCAKPIVGVAGSVVTGVRVGRLAFKAEADGSQPVQLFERQAAAVYAPGSFICGAIGLYVALMSKRSC